MSSSGLIYAVIVGAWAAYLVPMWLRRQDELNEARPTERFSTAIRLLSGRAAMERKAARGIEDDAAEPERAQPRTAPPTAEPDNRPLPGSAAASGPGPAREPAVPSAAFAPAAPPRPAPGQGSAPAAHTGGAPNVASTPKAPSTPKVGNAPSSTGRRPDPRRRATLLARRRRMVILLFAAFTVGMITAAVGGVALLWLPAIPAVLFSVYIAHLRRQERRRFEVKLDRRRAADAAQRLRERERERRRAAAVPATEAVPAPAPSPRPHDFSHPGSGSGSGVHHVRALVEAADTDETDDSDDLDEADSWSAAPRERSADAESWDPVPVPLPTYVTAPVASRSTGGPDRPGDAWPAATRHPAAPPPAQTPQAQAPTPPPRKRPPATPLFDQYADDAPHPRAANE